MPATSSDRLRSLGWRTDVALESDESILEEREEFIVIRTRSNPGYYFGNALLFDRSPQTGDEDRWPAYFESAFAGDAAVRHAAFAWSGGAEVASIEPFIERGYSFQERAVLTASTVADCAVPAGLYVRRFRCDNDWNAQLDLALANREEQYDETSYREFKTRQVLHQRRIAESFGVWLGAFDAQRLVGSCGIFSMGDGIARYQEIGVHPDYRRRGIARSLLAAAAQFAVSRFSAKLFVIVADAGGFARRIYESAGFTLCEREGALWIASR